MSSAHPILTCSEALAFEKKFLNSEALEWKAMQRAGRALGKAVMWDFEEVSAFPEEAKVLVLAGKGHNAGDAFLAAQTIAERYPKVTFFLLASSKLSALKPLALKAYERVSWKPIRLAQLVEHDFDVCIDGLLGMQFKPPVRKPMDKIIEAVNAHETITMRVAVDLPSGLGTDCAFQADFTYATGIAKAPLFEEGNAEKVGRVRYLDIGFFETPYQDEASVGEDVLCASVLKPLTRLRKPRSDKRSFGHLFIVAGSRSMPGALLMAAQAAVRSGVGLVTAFVPESVAAQFAAVLPEVMWVPWPETPEGGLALEGKHLLMERLKRGTALLMGPGMGQEKETQLLVQELVKEVALPLVLDADALSEATVDAAVFRSEKMGPVVATPHVGEYKRMSGLKADVVDVAGYKWFCHKNNIITLLKGPMCKLSDGQHVVHSPFGGPVLARGGSGDVLAGLTAGLLAQNQSDAFTATCQAMVWHGKAADLLARQQGQVAVATTDLLNYLAPALRETK